MDFLVIIILGAVLGFYVAKNIRDKNRIKILEKNIDDHQKVIFKQNEILNIYRETINKYESFFQGVDIPDVPKVERYDLDDILNEISEIGINNLSPEKLKFLKNYKKWK